MINIVNSVPGLIAIYIIAIVVLVIVGAVRFFSKSKETECLEPSSDDTNQPILKNTTKEIVLDKLAPVEEKTEDSGELVAVITAAIAAMLSETAGHVIAPEGLIVRSIKKRR